MNTELELRLAHIENRVSELTEKIDKLYMLSFPDDKESDKPEDVKTRMAKDVLDSFDFERVSNVMKSLNWIWIDKGVVPTPHDLKDKAWKMFLDAWIELEDEPFDSNDSRETTISTGGFEVFVQEWRDENDKARFFCSLKFILEEMSTDE